MDLGADEERLTGAGEPVAVKADGRFEIAGLWPGRANLLVATDGGTRLGSPTLITIGEREIPGDIELDMRRPR